MKKMIQTTLNIPEIYKDKMLHFVKKGLYTGMCGVLREAIRRFIEETDEFITKIDRKSIYLEHLDQDEYHLEVGSNFIIDGKVYKIFKLIDGSVTIIQIKKEEKKYQSEVGSAIIIDGKLFKVVDKIRSK